MESNDAMTTQTMRPGLIWLLIAAALFAFLYAIKAILLPFVVGMLVAYFLDPAADRLERWGLSRALSTSVITLLFFGLLALLLLLLLPRLIHQSETLIAHLPQYMDTIRTKIELLTARYGHFLGAEEIASAREAVNGSGKSVASALGALIQGLLSSGAALVNLASLMIISPIVSFYLLRDWDRIIAKIDDLLPRKQAKTIREQVALMDATISGYVRGVGNVMFVLGLFYVIGLSLVGLDFAILIGLLGGVAIIVPYVGTIVSGAAAVGMAYFQFDSWEPVAITLAIFTAGQLLEGYILTPKLVGDKIGLHPLWLIFAMLAGAALFGFVGIFIAIPTSAIIGVLVRFALARYRESMLYQTKGQ